MEHEFLLGIFHPEKQDYLFRSSVASRNYFSAGTTKKVMFYLLSNQIFRKLFVNGKQPVFHFWLYCPLCQPKRLHHSVVPARFISKRGFASRGDPLIKMMRLIVIPLWFKMRKWVMHNQKKGPLWH